MLTQKRKRIVFIMKLSQKIGIINFFKQVKIGTDRWGKNGRHYHIVDRMTTQFMVKTFFIIVIV